MENYARICQTKRKIVLAIIHFEIEFEKRVAFVHTYIHCASLYVFLAVPKIIPKNGNHDIFSITYILTFSFLPLFQYQSVGIILTPMKSGPMPPAITPHATSPNKPPLVALAPPEPPVQTDPIRISWMAIKTVAEASTMIVEHGAEA